MIDRLKNNHLSNNFFLLFLTVVLWGIKFVFLPPNFFLPEKLIPILNIDFPAGNFWFYTSLILTPVSFIIIAITLNGINLKLPIITEAYQSPGIFFVIFSGLYFGLHSLTPELIANILMLIGLFRITEIHKTKKAFTELFDAGFLLGLASFFYFNIIVLTAFFIIAILTLRVFYWKEIVVFFLGLIAPYIVLAVMLFLIIGELEIIKNYFEQSLFIEKTEKYNSLNFIIALPLLITFLFGVISRIAFNAFKKVITQKYINIIVWLSLFLAVYFAGPFSEMNSMVFLFVPISILTANLFVNTQNKVSAVLFFTLLISVLIVQGIQIMYYLYI